MRANIFVVFLILLLSGCGGGSSGANGPDPFNPGTDPVLAMSIEILDSNCESVSENSFTTDENICVQATLTSDGNAVSGEIVNFSLGSSIAQLSSDTALTNSSGVAQTIISSTSSTSGATIVTATYDTATATANFQYEASASSDPELSMTSYREDCATPAQSFGTNETICVLAELTQGETPLSNEIVNFALSSGLGSLDRTTALTNAQGIAKVNITNNNETIGAASISASFNTLSDASNYEYVAVNQTVTTSPSITVALYQNGEQVNGFQANQEVIARATVRDSDGNPVPEVIVSFSVQGTGPTLTPSSALSSTSGIAEVDLTATESDLGAYALQAETTVNAIQISGARNFEVRSAGAVIEGETRFGHFDSDGNFVEGIIGSSIADENGDVTISAGATTGFDVALVDENGDRISTPTPVTFTSTCVTNNQATIDETVTTINGVASATFEDLSCAGASGNTDQIVASVVINNETTTITRELTILPEGIGSISFVSATPDAIVLTGTGGQNTSSVSTLIFQVNGELGNPIAQQEVAFALNTTAGGLKLDPAVGLTNSTGQVSTRVTAGTVPTPVRVTASVTAQDNDTIRTQSDLLTVNTGLPDQNSFTLSADTLNSESFNITGQTVNITVRLADIFNNPVPNGTTVNFTTEYGSIEGSCETGEDANGNIDPELAATGTCSVTWTSQNPRDPVDHRNTILATAIGHETLFDSNGNNAYDDVDGGAIIDNTDSGFGVSRYGSNGFVDYSEAWVDYNEDGVYQSAEPFIDFNGDETFNSADGLFNGPQCNSASACSDDARSIHIRRAISIVLSSSSALWRIYADDISDNNNIIATNDSNVTITNGNVTGSTYLLADGESSTFILVYYDTNEQVLAAGTELGTINANGDISVVIDRVNNTNQNESSLVPGSIEVLTTITNEIGAEDSGTSVFSYAIDSPSGTRTNVEFSVRREDP